MENDFVAELKAQLIEKEKRIEHIKLKTKEHFQSFQQTISEKDDQITELKEQIIKIQNNDKKDGPNLIEFEKEIELLNQEIASKSQLIESIQAELDHTLKTCQNLTIRLEEMKLENQKLSQNSKVDNDQIQALVIQCELNQNLLEQVRSQSSLQEFQISELQLKKSIRMNINVLEHNSVIQVLQQQEEESRREMEVDLTSLRTKLEEERVQCTALYQSLRTTQHERDYLREEGDKLLSERDEVSSRVLALLSRISSLETSLETKDKQLDREKKQVEEYKSKVRVKLEEMMSEQRAQTQALETANQTLQASRDKEEQSQARIHSLEQQLQDLLTHQSLLQNQISSLKEEKNTIDTSLHCLREELRGEREIRSRLVEEELQASKEELERMRGERDALQTKRLTAKSETISVSKQLEKYQTEREEVKAILRVVMNNSSVRASSLDQSLSSLHRTQNILTNNCKYRIQRNMRAFAQQQFNAPSPSPLLSQHNSYEESSSTSSPIQYNQYTQSTDLPIMSVPLNGKGLRDWECLDSLQTHLDRLSSGLSLLLPLSDLLVECAELERRGICGGLSEIALAWSRSAQGDSGYSHVQSEASSPTNSNSNHKGFLSKN